MTEIHFPNESEEYRKARNELLKAELDLRAKVEAVAKQRRSLPPGGPPKEDYVFEELVDGKPTPVKMSDLFAPGKDELFVYSFMYAPDMKAACPMCTSLLDGLDGQKIHIDRRVNFVVVAKHSLEEIHKHAKSRGWTNLRLLSSANNSFNADYHAEIEGRQTTMAHVFRKQKNEVRHFWSTEMSYAGMIEGGNMRHVDMIWPLWNVLDFTAGGRGDWYPQLAYE